MDIHPDFYPDSDAFANSVYDHHPFTNGFADNYTYPYDYTLANAYTDPVHT